MKKAIVSILALLSLFVAGFAIKYYVEQQTAPLDDRINRLEAVERSGTASAERAEMAAMKAQQYMDSAEAASKKAEKVFELQQRK